MTIMGSEEQRAAYRAGYLKSLWWLGRRERALYLAQWRCQSPLCEHMWAWSLTHEERMNTGFYQDVKLHVHHLTYDNLGRELDDDLIVLCNDCHKQVHERTPIEEAPYYWRMYREWLSCKRQRRVA